VSPSTEPSSRTVTTLPGAARWRGYLSVRPSSTARSLTTSASGSRPQDAHLFSTTIRENVLIGRPGASESELEESLRRARLWEWVSSLPVGLDTLVGEEGTQLSGGQRQRIALARALLAAAPVLVLDEPTAHLDPETAEEVVRDMLSAAGDRSVLLITHRQEGLNLVDEVVTLSGGQIVSRSGTRITRVN
jgi:ABC-type multidrug transport system fused ATPase/permease subunit